MSSFQAPGDFSLSEGVGKRLMTPGGAVAPGVAPELMPVLVLENDRPENLLLSAQRMFARSGVVVAGGAGTRASVSLVNNRADQLVTVELITALGAFQVAIYRGALGAVPFGTQLLGMPRDTRIGGSAAGLVPSSTAILVTDNTLSALTTLVYQGAAAATYTTPIVLGPGDILWVGANVDAAGLSGWSLAWRERRLNQSERL